MTTTVSLAAGRIIVRPSLVDLLQCSRLGGRWENAVRGWVFPATASQAKRLRASLRHVPTDDATVLESLISGAQPLMRMEPRRTSEATEPATPAVAPVAAPEPPAEPEVPVPQGMKTRPWRHQKVAFKFCLDHFSAGLRGILLAMGMGTGKSLVACMLVLWLAARRTLIVAPLRVVQVWVAQFEKHVGLPVVLVALDEDIGSVADKMREAAVKMELARVLGKPFIAVINYDSAWRDPFAEWAEKVTWDLVIADEAHRIKAPGGKASLFFKRLRLRAAHRVALTGTPMPHGPMDIYAIFRFLDISIFGPSFTAFRTKYAVMGGYQKRQITGFQNLDDLQRLMSKVTFKVGDEVLDLPPATDVTYNCALTGEAARIYKDLDEDFVARVQDGTITAANAMVKLLRLQQITGGCVPTDDDTIHRIDSSKQKLLADVLEDIGTDRADGFEASGEPVVVFCRFVADLLAVHEVCEQLKLTSLELSGKRDELKRWQAGEAQVLAVQIDAGSEGVDFTRARYSIFYSVGYSLGKYDQARKRTHRPGQTKPVTHIHLIARGTVDVKVMRALEKRADIVQSILAEIKGN
ncbi:MAG TPA: DEAD/DEAH box helicase [Bryobacteraceae bacterium]|nr:DEAD/DEAH box helicase [Bryobacteraceae bacterium]